MNRVTFMPFNVTTEVPDDTTLMEAAQSCGIELTNQCAGKGVCGRCKVQVLSGEVKLKKQSLAHLTRQEMENRIVLACQAVAKGDISVDVLQTVEADEVQIMTEGGEEDARLVYTTPGEASIGPEYPAGYLEPLVGRIDLTLPEPTLTDNLTDLERLQRGLRDATHDGPFRVSRRCLLDLAETLRKTDWKVSVLRDRSGEQNVVAAVDEPRFKNGLYGLAVDVGTTTVVVQLVNLKTGRPVDTRASQNAQIRYGEDVISRMVFACGRGGLEPLHRAVIDNLNSLTRELLKANDISPRDVCAMAAAANTTMSHILYGLAPCHIRLEPYIPTADNYPPTTAEELGLDIHPRAPIFLLPSVASYVGGDIVAGVMASGLAESPETEILMDIGTNGEIVVGNNEWLMTCAASAGPAFEGGGVACGMRASRGAVEKVEIEDGECRLDCVGDAAPVGICGSGLISAISALLEAGIINRAGKFNENNGHPGVVEIDDEPAYMLYGPSDGSKGVYITESDIGNLMKSKGAVFAALKTMIDSVGLGLDDIDRLYVSGGFGNYLNIDDAVAIGLLPDMPREKISFIGNSSLTGARMCLTNRSAWQRSRELARRMTYLELSTMTEFMDEFVASLFLPHTDMKLFPSQTP